MASQQPEYSLKESFKKVGILPIPIFKDDKGNIIDGFNRARTGVKLPEVILPIENRLQFNLIKLVINAVRRTMTAEEKTATLVNIAELSGWSPTKMAEKLPFSYEWIMKYIPSEYKNREKAAAGKLGGRPRIESEGALRRKAKKEEHLEPKISETEKQFCTRFTGTFKTHLSQILKKDLPVIISHMNAEHDCSQCNMTESCQFLLAFVMNLKPQLPMCMQERVVLTKVKV